MADDTTHRRRSAYWRDRCRFSPSYLKREFFDVWDARYEPWREKREDERGLPKARHINAHPAEMDRAAEVGHIEHLLLALAVAEPVLYDALAGLYLDRKRSGERWTAFEVAEHHGCHWRTVYKREYQAREWIAKRLGWDKNLCDVDA